MSLLPPPPPPGAPGPRHRAVEAWMRHLIAQPPYAEGQVLPDEVTLAAHLGVSRSTVRTAFSHLVQEGRLERRPRLGTRVVPRVPDHRLEEWISFRAALARQGIRVVDFSVEAGVSPLPAAQAATLALAPGDPALRLLRIRGWDGQAILATESWIHPRLGLDPWDDFRQPLYQLLREKSRLAPARSREWISAELPGPEPARWLDLDPTQPVLVRRRQVLDAQGRPMEAATNWYRADRCQFSLELAPGAQGLGIQEAAP